MRSVTAGDGSSALPAPRFTRQAGGVGGGALVALGEGIAQEDRISGDRVERFKGVAAGQTVTGEIRFRYGE